jgi:hypothetical protein
MSSPFPGVDPYIEAQHWWRDFHLNFLAAWQDQLLGRLPDEYDARIEESVHVLFDDEHVIRDIYPDLMLEAPRQFAGGVAVLASEMTDVETVTLTLPPSIDLPARHLQIVRRPDRELVTVLELLSPTNKGSGYFAYSEKRGDLLATEVHLVELDLLIRGRKLPMREPLPSRQFHAFISRGNERPKCQVSSWTLRRPLPAIRIPLLRPDEHVVSDLQEVYDATYTRARYERAVDYRKPLDLPLSDADRVWLAEQMQNVT